MNFNLTFLWHLITIICENIHLLTLLLFMIDSTVNAEFNLVYNGLNEESLYNQKYDDIRFARQIRGNSSDTIKIGYLTNMYGVQNSQRQGIVISGAITYAISKINGNSSLLGGRKLELISNDTSGQTLKGTSAMLDQWRRGAVAFFGPEDTCDVEATIAAALNLTMISYKCADSKLLRKDLYPTFTRTHPSDTQVVRSVIALLRYYKWNKFSIIWENTPQYSAVVKSLTRLANEQNFLITGVKKYENYHDCCSQGKPCCPTSSPFSHIVEETYRETRIYVFFGKTFDLQSMMLSLRMRGLLEHGEYIVIYVDLEEEYLLDQSYKYIWTKDIGSDEKKARIEASQSLLVIVPSPPKLVDYSDFEEKVREFNAKPPFNIRDPPLIGYKRHITIYASYLYDSVMLFCEALSQIFAEGSNEYDGRAIIKKIINRKRYLSVTGIYMNIDENGDVEGNYTVLTRMPTPDNIVLKGFNGTRRPSHVFLPVGNFEYDEASNETLFKLDGVINWVSGHPPLDEPPCGFDGSVCIAPPDNRRQIIAGVLLSIFIIITIIAIISYRNWKYEQEIAGLLWKIKLNDIHFYAGVMPLSTSRMSLISQESRMHSQIFTQTANYRGSTVAVKQMRFHKRIFDIPRETKKEMKLMKEIHHDNINPFIGAYIEPSCIYIVTEYCAKGSLVDILENDDLKLDNMFIASLVFDLISAMTFLHDSDIKTHGNLKSPNCVVSSRWVLQVTDFGLHQLRANAETESNTGHNYYRNLLWKAPELLRTTAMGGTQKADVYSFGIILHEIIAREGPFGINVDDSITAKEIIHRVKEICSEESEPFRPDLGILLCEDYVMQTICECWSEVPENRPDFRTIRQKLKRLRHGMKSNIMDHMMMMMEKYANNLEDIVEERTAQLVEEKKKTETLLHRMLPKTVAAQLMRGEDVVPESFDAVTIFFSDIVGFTSMSASSCPMEVVTFLNDLYTLFDSIICNYDVYKVETIGDAYMVVSGLPIKNGEFHAREIASMALELLESVKTFKIRHRHDETLQLRIGIHTGPVVAGVVGTTMPRYCLFGDTVNTASRMESNGEALKIHISPQCRNYLERLGGYIIQERGLVNMKGKGDVRTYWLLSHVQGVVHRRESAPDDCPVQSFSFASDFRKRSPKTSLPRKGSLVAFRNESDGSSVNISNSRKNPFLRLKALDSNISLKNNSPKPVKKILRNSKNTSKDQMNDISESCNILNSSRSRLKMSSSFSSKPTVNFDELMMEERESNRKCDSLAPLLGDHDNMMMEDTELNLLFDNESITNREDKDSISLYSRVPLLRASNRGDNILSKKWHSCAEIGCHSSVTQPKDFKKTKLKSSETKIITNDDHTLKDWIMGLVKNKKINALANDITLTTNNSIMRESSNGHLRHPNMLNSINLTESGFESVV